MATYYDYQAGNPNSAVNWAEVGANFSNILQEEVRVREEKKAAIDEASRQQQIIFDTAVTGDSPDMNDWTLDFADKGTKQLQILDRLLKSGSLSVKDYTKSRQNLSDGTGQLFDLAAGYQAEYENKMLRADCTDPSGVGCSQQLELEMMSSVEGFGNFSNSEAVIDPQTGRVMVGFSKFNEEKGIWELDSDPNSLVGINSLNNRIKGEFNLYDMDGAVVKGVKSFGKYETIRRKIGTAREKGLLTKISDPKFNTEESVREGVRLGIFTEEDAIVLLSGSWDTVRDQWLNSQTADPKVVSSLLTNNLGKDVYKFTFNPTEAAADKDELTILLKNVDNQVVPDFTTDIGKRQKEKAQEGLTNVLEGAMDHTVETAVVSDYTKPTQPSAASIAAGREQEVRSNAVGLWNSSYGATVENMNANMDALINSPQGQQAGLLSAGFVETPNGDFRLEYTKTDARQNRTGENGILIPKDATQEQWAKAGIVIHGEVNAERSMEGFTGEGFNPENLKNIKSGYDKLPVPEDPYQTANTFIRSIITGDTGIEQTEEAFIADFESDFSSLGFTVKKSGSIREQVTITAPNKDIKTFYTNFELNEKTPDEGTGKNQQTNLRNWMTSHLTDEGASAWMRTGIGNSLKETEEQRLEREGEDKDALANAGKKLSYRQWIAKNKGGTAKEYDTYYKSK